MLSGTLSSPAAVSPLALGEFQGRDLPCAPAASGRAGPTLSPSISRTLEATWSTDRSPTGPKPRLHAVALPSKGGGCSDSSALPLAPESSPRAAAAVSSPWHGAAPSARRAAYTMHLTTAPQSFPPLGPRAPGCHPAPGMLARAQVPPAPALPSMPPTPTPHRLSGPPQGSGLSPPLLSGTASTTPGSGCWSTSCRYGCMCAPQTLTWKPRP